MITFDLKHFAAMQGAFYMVIPRHKAKSGLKKDGKGKNGSEISCAE
jgi:hypothetical protein